MANKGKAVTTEIDEVEDEFQDLIESIEAQDEEKEDAFQISVLPPDLPPWNRKAKIPKDLDAAKSMLQTPLLPDEIRFDGLPLG